MKKTFRSNKIIHKFVYYVNKLYHVNAIVTIIGENIIVKNSLTVKYAAIDFHLFQI